MELQGLINFGNVCGELVDIFINNCPYNLKIYTHIIMNDSISKATNSDPIDIFV